MGIYDDDSVKNLKFLHGTTDITNSVKVDSFSVENILCDDQLNFGSCNSARAQFATIEDLNLTGEQIIVQYGNASAMTNLGVYKVTYTSKKENSTECVLTMYDIVKNFDVDIADWYIGLTFPMTLKDFRDALCLHCGVVQNSAILVNDSMQVNETIAPSKLNAMDVMKWIGELNGVFPHASNDGKLDWVSLGSFAKTVQKKVIQGTDGFVKKSYTTKPIGKVVIRSEDGDIGGSAGTGTNTVYITGNALCYGFTSEQLGTIAQNVLNKVEGVSYTPVTISMKTNPEWNMGDLLTYEGSSFYILSRSTSGLLFDEIKCEGKEYLEEDDSVETSVEQLRGKTNVLTRDVEQTTSRIENIEDDYTTHTEFVQTADALQVEIKQIESQLDGDIELFYVDEPPTLLNYPAWDWTGIYARNGLDVQSEEDEGVYYASDDLYFPYPNTELQKHLRSIAYDEENTLTYRFIKSNGVFYWQEVADTETSLILQKIAELKVTTEEISAEVGALEVSLDENYYTTTETDSKIQQKADSITQTVSATYTTKDTTNALSTQVQANTTSISQTATAITQEVTRATGKENEINGKFSLYVGKNENNQIVSMLNASADEIKLNGGSKIHLASAGKLVIDSGNFQLNSNGDVTCTNANVTGKITSSDATITGGTINLQTSADTSAIEIDRTWNSGSLSMETDSKLYARGLEVENIKKLNGSNAGYYKIEYGDTNRFFYGNNSSDAVNIGSIANSTYVTADGMASIYVRNGDLIAFSIGDSIRGMFIFDATAPNGFVEMYTNSSIANWMSYSMQVSSYSIYKLTITGPSGSLRVRIKKVS